MYNFEKPVVMKVSLKCRVLLVFSLIYFFVDYLDVGFFPSAQIGVVTCSPKP